MNKTVETLDSGAIVYWNHGKLLSAPRKNRPNRRETKYPVECPTCGHSRWLAAGDARRAGQCNSCSSVEKGRKAFAVLVARYGREKAIAKLVDFAREQQLRIPQPSEQLVTEWLQDAGLPVQPQRILHHAGHHFIVDAYVDGLIVEVNGGVHKLDHKQKRDALLVKYFPGKVLFVSAKSVLETPETAKEQIFKFIGQAATQELPVIVPAAV